MSFLFIQYTILLSFGRRSNAVEDINALTFAYATDRHFGDALDVVVLKSMHMR